MCRSDFGGPRNALLAALVKLRIFDIAALKELSLPV